MTADHPCACSGSAGTRQCGTVTPMKDSADTRVRVPLQLPGIDGRPMDTAVTDFLTTMTGRTYVYLSYRGTTGFVIMTLTDGALRVPANTVSGPDGVLQAGLTQLTATPAGQHVVLRALVDWDRTAHAAGQVRPDLCRLTTATACAILEDLPAGLADGLRSGCTTYDGPIADLAAALITAAAA